MCAEYSFWLTPRGFNCHGCDATGSLKGLQDRLDYPASSFEVNHDTDAVPVFMTLGALMANPDILKPPECVVPRIGYRGRLVILAGPDKSGKSTLMGHATAAVSLGRTFLGERCAKGRVLLLGLEEATGDSVRRLVELGTDAEQVQLVTRPVVDIYELADTLLTAWPADLVVVDSLIEYARVTIGSAPDDGDNAGWASVVRPLVALARKHETAIVLLHHVRRSDGQYRGAGEIAAAADAVLEMSMPTGTQDPCERRIKGRGRWMIEPFIVALRDGRYELSGGDELSVDALVLLHVDQHPGASKNSVRNAVQRRASAVDAAINRLLERGAIRDRGRGGKMSLSAPSGQVEMEDTNVA